MPRNRLNDLLKPMLLLLAGTVALPAVADAAPRDREVTPGPWFSVGVGGAAVRSSAPAPSASREGLAGSIELGYRFTREWGIGLDFGAVAPVNGCPDWRCASSAAEFAPNFTRVFAFGEYRVPNSGWRLRAGAGVSRFCYSRHWSANAWNWGDFALALLDEDYLYDTVSGSGAYRCDARTRAMGGSVSIGYDWRLQSEMPLSMGLRLTAEAANFDATRSIGLPGFRHRAVTLSLHLNLN